MNSFFSPEPEMLELFRKDVREHLAGLNQDLAAFKIDRKFTSEAQTRIRTAFGKIRGAASLLQFKQLATCLGKLKELNDTQILDIIAWISCALKLTDSELIKCCVEGDQVLNKIVESLSSNVLESSLPQIEQQVLPVPYAGKMFDLFKNELEVQVKQLSEGVLELEQDEISPDLISRLMRSAHSLKGAARVINLSDLTELAHTLEDYFLALQKKSLTLNSDHIDLILEVIDFLSELPLQAAKEFTEFLHNQNGLIKIYIARLKHVVSGAPIIEKTSEATHQRVLRASSLSLKNMKAISTEHLVDTPKERIVRVTAHSLNRLMGLAGESLVESRWLYPFSESLNRFKKTFNDVSHLVDQIVTDSLDGRNLAGRSQSVAALKVRCNQCQESISNRLAELDAFINRNSSISDRLYREVIQSRMRVFSDAVETFPRIVRDLSRQLGKKVRLEVEGNETQLDRDILEKLISPLTHIIRNAIDHGIEFPADRIAAGKPEEGLILIKAEHKGGMISITISDDGKGLDFDAIRSKIVKKGLTVAEIAAHLNEQELVDFIFLPGFSLANDVTDISGRGFGLHIVQEMVDEVSGHLEVESVKGRGVTLNLRLPLTLSVVRSLIVEISGEPYAFSLGRIERALLVSKESIVSGDKGRYFVFDDKHIKLLQASQLLGVGDSWTEKSAYPIVLLSDEHNIYGLVVDSFSGEKELVVQELDQRLGKIPNISAGAFFEDGSPLLMFDVEDLIGSFEKYLDTQDKISASELKQSSGSKHILVADDSPTVREHIIQILATVGYKTTGVKNGRDAWNALRLDKFDLLITDIDMPRLNGIELIKLIRENPTLKSLPVVIISYKDSEQHQKEALQEGANAYLTKGGYTKDELLTLIDRYIGQSNAGH